MPLKPLSPILLASLGNPSELYKNTLHSAGHTVLTVLGGLVRYPEFTKLAEPPHGLITSTTLLRSWRKQWGPMSGMTWRNHAEGFEAFKKSYENGDTEDWSLWQSPTLMNVSGPAVRKAWEGWKRGFSPRDKEGLLLVVHDELELPLGQIALKRMRGTEFSARGHNGLKSVIAHMPKDVKWLRLGVGIGRPQSRESKDVAAYVLRKMNRREADAMIKAAGDIEQLLRKVEEGQVGWA